MDAKEFKRIFDKNRIITINSATLKIRQHSKTPPRFADIIIYINSLPEKKYKYFGKSCDRFIVQ